MISSNAGVRLPFNFGENGLATGTDLRIGGAAYTLAKLVSNTEANCRKFQFRLLPFSERSAAKTRKEGIKPRLLDATKRFRERFQGAPCFFFVKLLWLV